MSEKAIPPGHTFFDFETLITCKGKEVVKELVKRAGRRNPDAFDMYIYNDFYGYAVLDLVDKTLATINSMINEKDYNGAFSMLEGLNVFNELDSSWLMCDDGDRVRLTNKVYGAAVVTLLRALRDEGRLDATHFPSLEAFLRRAAEWCKDTKEMSASDPGYGLVCKAIGRRLFKDKSPAIIALEEARLQEYKESLEAGEAEDLRDIDEDDEEDDDDDDEPAVKEPWYSGGQSDDEDENDPDFVLSNVWKQYKQYLRRVPTKPLRGPGSWDLDKWTTAQKAEFVFDGDSDEEFEDDYLDI